MIKLGFLREPFSRGPFSRGYNGLKNVNKVITKNFFLKSYIKKKDLNFNQPLHRSIIQ